MHCICFVETPGLRSMTRRETPPIPFLEGKIPTEKNYAEKRGGERKGKKM